MNANNIEFPAALFGKDPLWIMTAKDGFVSTQKALRIKWHNGKLLVDSAGIARWVKEVHKIRDYGSFWGWDKYFNRRIVVEFIFDGEPFAADVEDIRRRIFEDFQKYDYWHEIAAFHRLRKAIYHAKSVRELVLLIAGETPI